jgi:tetratricopeptide (TPR) repeat protein
MSRKRGFQAGLRILLLLLTPSAVPAQPPDGSREADDVWASLVREAGSFQHDYQFGKAAEIAGRAWAAARQFAPNDPRRAMTHLLLANIYHDWGHCAESRANYAYAAAIWQKSSPPDSKAIFIAVMRQISGALECNNLPAAENLFQTHSDELQHFRSGPLDDATVLQLQSSIALRRGRYGEAENLARKALGIFESSPGAQAADTADMRNLLSLAASKRHRYLESFAEAQRAMALLEAADPRNPCLVASLNNAAYALHLLRRIDESAGFYQRALDLSREVLGEENRVTAIILLNYASCCRLCTGLKPHPSPAKDGRYTAAPCREIPRS